MKKERDWKQVEKKKDAWVPAMEKKSWKKSKKPKGLKVRGGKFFVENRNPPEIEIGGEKLIEKL